MSVVAIEKCEEYNLDILYEKIETVIKNCGGLEGLKGKKILLKPNLLAPSAPEKAVTTHPIFLQAVIKYLKNEINPEEIFVGDSPGVGTQNIIYKTTGLQEIIDEEKVKIANFKEKIEIKVDGKYVKSFFVAKAFKEVDAIISLPKLKTHGMTYYTGAMKNLFGMIPGLSKPQFHYKFPEKEKFGNMIVDLNFAIKPYFAIMDGVVSMEGNGPRNGTPRNTNLVLASSDLLALDSTACRVININPEKIAYIKNGYQRNFGKIKKDEIELIGNFDDLDELIIKNYKHIKRESDLLELVPLPKFINDFLRETLMPKPKFNHDKCILCKECIKVCPSKPKALKIEEGRVKIDRNNCIRCFCCQEMCPVNVIEPKLFVKGD